MDLKVYYQQIRETVELIDKEWVVVASKATENGGKAGVLSEVHRNLAARLIVDKRADLATEEETETYYARQRAEIDAAKEAEERTKIQLTVVSGLDLAALRNAVKEQSKT